MAITYLQAINKVLIRLRESQLSSLSGVSGTGALVAEYVNQAKEEVETAWNWNALKTSVTLTMVSGTSQYLLTGFGDEYNIELVYNNTHEYAITGPFTYATVKTLDNNNSAGSPWAWTIAGVSSSTGDPYIEFYPVPGSGDEIIVYARAKQTALTAASDVLLVPWRPVVFRAYALAVSERGEDGGVPYDEIMRDYEMALASAIGYDANVGHRQKDWYAD